VFVVAWLPGIYLRGFREFGPCSSKRGFLTKLVCATAATYESYAQCLRSLPSDDEMIANFHKHRADFDRLAQIYRGDLSVPTDFDFLQPTPEVKRLMDRINVAWVEGDGVIWLPETADSTRPDLLRYKRELLAKPYSPERRKFSGVILGYAHKKVESLKNLMYGVPRFLVRGVPNENT